MSKPRKPDKTGRSTTSERHIRLPHWLTGCAAFATLTGNALKVLIGIWRRHDGRNNGLLGFSAREGMAIGLSKDQTARALTELQRAGFLVCVRAANFNMKNRAGQARLWRLTAEPCGTAAPTKDFMRSAGSASKVNGAMNLAPVPAAIEPAAMRSPCSTLQ